MTAGQGDDIDWARVEALFPDLLELPPAQRARFLDRHCTRDPALRHELEAMLAASERDSVLDHAPQVRAQHDAAHADDSVLSAEMRVGAWRIVRMIGRGGMGEVYLAERAEGGFTQQAAIKLLHPDASQHAERFEDERRILAQLTHPHIARLLDGGFHHGRAWMAMEYVPGQGIADYCRGHALSLRARLKLFHQVCAAVSHAHAALVIHRDLKPSNILVNETGQVKLLDFGIAKLVDPHAPDARITQATPFTPDHAAPEQIEGAPATTAVDIYALGVVLYELLCDRLPWSFGDTALSRAVDRLLREDPPPPSQVAGKHGDRPLPARELQGDLDAIVGRCLRRTPLDRYPSVQALQDDLDRHAQAQPVLAHQGGHRYRLRLWFRRNRILAIAAALAGISLLAGLGAALWQADQARREAANARAQQAIAEYQRAQVRVQANSSMAVQELLMRMFAHAMAMDGGRSTSVADLVDAIRMMGAHDSALDDAARAQLFLRMARLGAAAGDFTAAKGMLAQADPLIGTAGAVRPRLQVQQLDTQLTVAVAMQDLDGMARLAPPLLRLLDSLPQPLDEEMLQLRLNALRSLGWAYDQQGKADESARYKREFLQASIARYGEDHPRTRDARAELSRAYMLQGRHAAAAELLREALREKPGQKPATRMVRVSNLIDLATAVRESGPGLPEALRLLRQAETETRTAGGVPDFYLPWILALQADVLREQGELAAAAKPLAEAARFRPTTGDLKSASAVRVVVLNTQSDLAWAIGDAAASAQHARDALAALGTPDAGDSGDRQRQLGLRLRVLRTQAAVLPRERLRTQVAAIVHDWDALPTMQRATYLAMAAESLRLGGIPDPALARRAVAAADAEPEPNPRRQASAAREQRSATGA
ncbi:MAG TPA: serine/threonine-protein kinase [Thermomonas sp.]|nr:serine/threonine-protein kinase [Thermomonas sp.]